MLLHLDVDDKQPQLLRLCANTINKLTISHQMNASAEGSLYELVARGNKDLFFYKEGGDFIFNNAYQPQTPFLEELRRVPPRTSVEFGRAIEFDFDIVGDLMKNPTLVIKLPTWLPLAQAANIRKSIIRDASASSQGITYGYVRGIAYFLFETISFYQDNILLQEFSGDTLWALSKISGTYGHSFIQSEQTGDHGGTALEISRNAAPPTLRLELPLIGCQNGFPQRAALKHSYRLRCKLRRLEDLVESSDPSATQKPIPWGQEMIQTLQSGELQFKTLDRTSIAPLQIQLETTQVYVQLKLENTPTMTRFRRLTENKFTQNQLDYSGVNGGGSSSVNRRLDGRHPASRIMWYFRNMQDVNANRLYKISKSPQSPQPYFNTVTLLIAGQTRELPRGPSVWRDLTNFAKEDHDSGLEISTMNWTLGSLPTNKFTELDITGSVNFTTADKPTLYIDLAQPGPIPSTELFVVVEGWAEFRTDGKGRAELFSGN